MKRNLLLLISLTSMMSVIPVLPASAVYNGSDAVGSPSVVYVIKENANGDRFGGCSGALIAPRVVVTAAHCVTENQTGLLAKTVWVAPPGANYKIIDENGKRTAILENTSSLAESRVIYEQYRAVSIKVTSTYYTSSDIVGDNDVAFLVLEKALPMTIEIVIASDEETESFITNKSTVRIYGYGETVFQDSSAPRPKTAIMNLEFKSTSVKNSAYLKSSASSACPGDSGGPVIVSTPTKLYLVGIITGGGIVTSGPECNTRTQGNFYTLITLITKYANLAFASSLEASKRSDTAQTLAEENVRSSKQAQTIAEANTHDAIEARANAEVARAKAESELLTFRNDLEVMRSQIPMLNLRIETLQTKEVSLKKKLLSICRAKPKPKRC